MQSKNSGIEDGQTEEIKDNPKFALLCEADGHDRPLFIIDLSLDRVLNEAIHPFNADEPFIIDGVHLKRGDVKRLKVLRQGPEFRRRLALLNRPTHEYPRPERTLSREQYFTRLEAILLDTCEDSTGAVMKAYDLEIKPKLLDKFTGYLTPNLVTSAMKFILEHLS